MTIERTIQIVQASFPQVYLACHTRHQRKRSSEHRLSPRDAAILAHLDEESPVTPARLATHLGVARSTLSEALKRLVALDYVRRGDAAAGQTGGGRTRTERVLLSPRGARAIRDTSVLETPRLRHALETATPRELRMISAGMAMLAAACRRYADKSPPPPRGAR